MADEHPLSRRDFIRLTAIGIGSVILNGALPACSYGTKKPTRRASTKKQATNTPASSPAAHTKVEPTASPTDALLSLIAGNRRFVDGGNLYPHRDNQRRAEVLTGQKPIAAILTCADSRVPPEILFDQGLGDIFIIRTAGNVTGDVGLGSLEYAVEHLGVSLVVVLGHQKCGAVSTAVAGGEAAGHIARVVEEIAPAVEYARTLGGDLLAASIDANIYQGVEKLKSTGPVLAEFVEQGKLEIIGARYDLDSGLVQWLTGSPGMMAFFPPAEMPTQAAPTEQATEAPPPENPATEAAQSAPATEASDSDKILGVHIVRTGESLFMIGLAYRINPWAIARLNKLADPNRIYAGQKLRIPNEPWKDMPNGKAARPQF